MAFLTLGGVEFGDFEVPGSMRFGGAQQLAVHELIGGVRVVDAMGRNDSAVRWAGVFSGGDASGRARMLDAMRAAGGKLTLAWDAFCYNVVIDRLDLDFRSPWWVPYQISCLVVLDLAQNIAVQQAGLADSILNDLASASASFDVSAAIAAISMPDALTQGNGDYAAATIALSNAGNAILQGVNLAEMALASNDLATIVDASGQLARLSAAQAYVGRALANLLGAGT